MNPDIDLLRGAYAAFARRDLPALLDAFHPEIEWVEPAGLGPFAGTRVGYIDTLGEVLTRLPENASEFRADAEEFLDAGDRIVVLGHHRGVNAAMGQAFEVPFAHVWTMKDGLAIRFRSYVDTALLRAALSVDA
jgi:hypothetical protein